MDECVARLRREFEPTPAVLDVYSALRLAKGDGRSDDPRDYLREMGYRERK